MVRPKTARKGKKDWRRNIGDEEEINFLEKTTRAERQGHVPEKLDNSQLFFTDKAGDGLSKPGRRSKREKKPLRCEMIINGSANSIPVATISKKPKGYDKKHRERLMQKGQQALEGRKREASRPVPKKEGDLWKGKALRESGRAARPLSVNGAAAVEVCEPGCSYNPDRSAHQDAVAVAVADEMQKIYKAELAPKPPPLKVDWRPEDDDELMRLQTEVGGDEDEDEAGGSGVEGSSGEEDEDGGRGGSNKLTRTQRNKQERRKAQEKDAVAKRALKRQRQQLEALKDVVKEVDEGEAALQDSRKRRKVAKEERMASQPRRLGKHRFEAPAVQVLLTEELTGGSLRKLKACPTVTRDRYKSLQRRELIEPRKEAPRHTFKRKEYERGSRGQLARDMHEETQREREKARKAKKAAAKNSVL